MEVPRKGWMGRKLADFDDLRPAEEKLVKEMASGRTVQIGPGVPDWISARDLRLRASFLRYLALGGCEACRPPEKGVRVKGAYIFGDGPAEAESGDTRGLDFEGCSLQGTLGLMYCRIPDPIQLLGAKAESLSSMDRTWREVSWAIGWRRASSRPAIASAIAWKFSTD